MGAQAILTADSARVTPGFYRYPCAIPGFNPLEQRHGKLGLSRALADGISCVLPNQTPDWTFQGLSFSLGNLFEGLHFKSKEGLGIC